MRIAMDRTPLIFAVLVLSFTWLACGRSSPGAGVSEESADLATLTPTFVPLILPLIAQSDGWNFVIYEADIYEVLGDDLKPEKEIFLVLVGEVQNNGAERECVTNRDWELVNEGGETYDFNFYAVPHLKEIYSVDEPGGIVGTCVEVGMTDGVFLVYDVDRGSKLKLTFRKDKGGQPVELNTASYIADVPGVTPTPTQVPTDTPSPTDTPIPVVTPVVEAPAGIGVSRSAVQTVYEQAGFVFEAASDVDGQPRVMGEGGSATIELIGPVENLTSATVGVAVSDDSATNTESVVVMMGLLKTVAPDWEGSAEWLANNLTTAINEGEVQTVHNNLQVKLSVLKELGLILLIVKGMPPGAFETVAEPAPAGPQVTAGNSNINLRSGPGTNYDQIGILTAGQSLEIIGRNADSSWWQVSTPNGPAWVAASVVTAAGVDASVTVVGAPPAPAVVEEPVEPAPVAPTTEVAPVPQEPAATDTPVPTVAPAPAGGAIVIAAVNYRDEYVDLQNTGGAVQDLTGWRLLSERGTQDCVLSGVIGPGETVRVWAMAKDVDKGGFNCGFDTNIWNNDEDDPAILFDAGGVEVGRK